MAFYHVCKLQDIITVIIPHFLKYPLQTQKGADFNMFYQISIILQSGEDLTLPDFMRILALKWHLNKGLPFEWRVILVYLTLSIHRHANDALQQMKARAKEGYAVDWQVCQVFPFGRLTIVLNVLPGSRFPLHTGLGNRIPFRKGRSVSVQWPSLSTDI